MAWVGLCNELDLAWASETGEIMESCEVEVEVGAVKVV